MKKILLLTQFFYPDRTGTGKILSDLFFALSKEKFLIDVISSRQMYNDKSNRVLKKNERFEGLNIHRVFNTFISKEKMLGRLYNYISFFFLTVFKVLVNSMHTNVDIIVVSSNPPIIPLFAAFLKNHRRKFVYILHDLYPDIAINMKVIKRTSVLSKIMYKINFFAFSKVDKIIVLGNDMRKYLIRNYDLEKQKISVIENWSEVNKMELKRNSKKLFRIIYSGNLGKFHKLDIAIKVISELNNAEMIFIGEGYQKKYLMEMSMNYKNIKFLSYLSDKKYKEILNTADAFFVSLERNLYGLAVPSKFYTYLSVGKPIICLSDLESEIANIIKKYKCGVVIDYDHLEFFKENLIDIINRKEVANRMGANGFKLFKEKYEKSIIIKKYEEIFMEI